MGFVVLFTNNSHFDVFYYICCRRVTAGFLQNLFQTSELGILNHLALFLVCGSILTFGRYSSLDSLIKIIGFVLLLSTLIAFLLVLDKRSSK